MEGRRRAVWEARINYLRETNLSGLAAPLAGLRLAIAGVQAGRIERGRTDSLAGRALGGTIGQTGVGTVGNAIFSEVNVIRLGVGSQAKHHHCRQYRLHRKLLLVTQAL
jgi:hypothetical protein